MAKINSRDRTWLLSSIEENTRTGGGGGTASSGNQTSGAQKTQIVDGNGAVVGTTANALDVNLKSGNVTLQAADIQIGAVELKDATTANRAVINSAGELSYATAVALGDAVGSNAALPITADGTNASAPFATMPLMYNGTTWDRVRGTSAAGVLTDLSLAKAEDSASADGDKGVPILAVRKATPANTSGTDGDYEPLQVSGGKLWVSGSIDQTTPGTTNKVSIGTDGVVGLSGTIPLPTGASTSANQASELTKLDSVITNTGGLGAAADAQATTDTGTFSLISLFKRLLVKASTGAANYANGQVTATTTAATLVAARATRRSVSVKNTDTAITVYIGAATVTSGNGLPLKPGESISVDTTALIQVIAASGSPAVAYIESYD